MRLIDADALKEAFSNMYREDYERWIKEVIDNTPTIKPTLDIWEKIVDYEHCDNVFVEQHDKRYRFIKEKKGKWIDTGRTWEETVDGFIRYGNVYECSACKAEDIECTPFCGYCGARMER